MAVIFSIHQKSQCTEPIGSAALDISLVHKGHLRECGVGCEPHLHRQTQRSLEAHQGSPTFTECCCAF